MQRLVLSDAVVAFYESIAALDDDYRRRSKLQSDQERFKDSIANEFGQ